MSININNKAKIGTGLGLGLIAMASAFIIDNNLEGLEYTVYKDIVGIDTVCYGATNNIDKNKVYTLEECNQLLQKDLDIGNKIIDKNVPNADEFIPKQTKVAFISFAFNVGPGRKGVKDGFATLKSGNKSTMLKKLLSGDIEGACYELPYWNHAGGKYNRGVMNRRIKELRQCLEGLK